MPDRSDVSLRGLAIGAALIVAGIAASLVAAAVMAPPAPTPQPEKVAGPALQTAPSKDLDAFLREKNARLHSEGPVDAGHVHIPIERAMQILAQGRER